MKYFLIFFISLVVFLNLKVSLQAEASSISDLTLCAENQTLDNRFNPYIQNGKLKTHPTCYNENLKIYDWLSCHEVTDEQGIEIKEKIENGKRADDFFDTVFDHCGNPIIFRNISPDSSDNYFAALLSMATFFYIRETRFINIGDIDQSSEFRKKFILAYLDFLTQSSKIIYPTLHRGNGDPWFKFQDGKFTNPPRVVGLIGENFAFFSNIGNRQENFSFTELSPLIGGYLYSNKSESSQILSSNTLTLAKDELVFITKTPIPQPPVLPVNPSPTPSPTPTSTSINYPFSFILPNPTPTSVNNNQNLTSPLTIQNLTPTPNQNESIKINEKNAKENDFFNLLTYTILSFIFIMIMHFAVNVGSEFNLTHMIFFFVLGGFLGYLFLGYEAGFVVGVVLSLIFIGGPRKDL